MPRDRDPSVRDRARSARADPSVAEQIVWNQLRGSKTGFKFRREHAVAGYRLDFYCHEALLAVELDGEQHDPARDALRDRALLEHGILTFRIRNLDFFGLAGSPLVDEVRQIQKLCEVRAGRPAFPAR